MRPIVTALVAVAAWAVCGPAWGTSFTLDLRNRRAGGTRPRLAAAAQEADGALRSFALGAGVADVGEVAVGDVLTVTLFDDVTVSLVLKEKMPSPLGGDVFLAEAAGYEGVKNAVVMRTADGLVMDVQDYLRKRIYKVISTADGVTVQEIEAKERGMCGCDTLKPPHSAGAKASASVVQAGADPRRTAKSANRLSFANTGADGTCVDILVAYEQNAATWVKSYGGGETNFAQMAVQKMNTALANVSLDSSFRFRLVGLVEVESETGDLQTALDSATYGLQGWEAVKRMRDAVGADIVTVLVETGSAYGMTGLGWSLDAATLNSFSESAYNVCSIRAVAQDHTMTHEVGHNMGCGHSDVQATQPGPQLYSYSSGYYFSAGGEKFHTIMAYGSEGQGGREVPYFSSPRHTHNGVAVGDMSHDNAQTLANTFALAASWRRSSTGEVSGGEAEEEDECFYGNDEFADAKELAGPGGRIIGSSIDATGTSGEYMVLRFRSRHTVWYKWTAEADGMFRVNVERADFDTVIAAFTGSSAGSLRWIIENDDVGDGLLSAISFPIQKGVTYHICLGGYEEAKGDFRLEWAFARYPEVSVTVADGCAAMGTVTGGGAYRPGTKVQLRATPAKDSVFIGWYERIAPSESTATVSWSADDFVLISKTPSYTYVVTDADVAFTAMFATGAEDAASLMVQVEDWYTEADGTFSLDLGGCVASLSEPKLAVSGLPAGLKYDAKTMMISGQASKPGVYTVSVKATNVSVKKATTASTTTFTLMVPNFECAALPHLRPEPDAYGIVRCGVMFDPGRINCLPAGEGWTVKVAGLPSGLKYDAKTGLITGVPTAKAGAYTVMFTASKAGEKNQVASITLNVQALPAEIVGAYNGMVNGFMAGVADFWQASGMMTLSVAANGKLSAKVTLPSGALSFAATGWDADDNGIYKVTMFTKAGDKLSLELDGNRDWRNARIPMPSSILKTAKGVEYLVVAWRNEHGKGGNIAADSVASDFIARIVALKKLCFVVSDNPDVGYTCAEVPITDKSANLTISFSANGAVKYSGKIGGKSVSGTTVLNVDNQDYYTIGNLAVPISKTEALYFSLGFFRAATGEPMSQFDIFHLTE